MIAVFDRIGGREGMAEWAMENRTEFYKIYAKLLPTEVHATVDNRDASQLSDDELHAIAIAGSAGVASETWGEGEAGSVH